ncbi:MAG TPA: TonB-dependent receptor, partial [Saprospiraceae bacterium]|nr:TonB-dependent receptor [Saprospiraceae bacterium]
FDLNLGWKKWALVSSISANDFGDLRMGGKGPDEYLRPFYVQRQDSVDVVVTNDDPRVQRPSGYSQINMMQKLRFKPNENWDFQYGFHYSETSDYSRYDRHVRYRNGLPRYGEWYYGPQKWMMNNLNLRHQRATGFYDQMSLGLAQQFFEESRISRDINRANREIRVEEVDAYSVNLDFVKSTGSRNELFYGLEYVYNDVTSTGINENISTGASEAGPARYPQSNWASYAAYVNDQYKFSDQWLLQAGLRYNHFVLDAIFDTTFYPFPFTAANISKGAVTGSAGLVYRPAPDWVISANFATAFRSPNVDDVGKVFDSAPGSVVVPNPDLEAEYAYNVDFSLAKVFSDVVKIDLSAYYTVLENALVRRNFTLNGLDSIVYDGELSQVQAIQNAAVANVYGIQAGIEVKLSAGFSFSSDFNYQKGEEELDDGSTSPSRHAPPWFGSSALTYSANRLNLQWYLAYSGERKFEDLPEEEKGKTEIYASDENGNPYSPGWYTLNFKATYRFTDHLTASAGLENLTDRRYRPYSSGIVAPGRNFILSLRANF